MELTSNILAHPAGARIRIGDTEFNAAPLLKEVRPGEFRPLNSGYPVTGIYDSFDQIEIAAVVRNKDATRAGGQESGSLVGQSKSGLGLASVHFGGA
jgi:hypothetical protein